MCPEKPRIRWGWGSSSWAEVSVKGSCIPGKAALLVCRPQGATERPEAGQCTERFRLRANTLAARELQRTKGGPGWGCIGTVATRTQRKRLGSTQV